MARKRDSLQRRGPRRQPKQRFLIVCEGTVTEPCYFRDVRHVERSLIELQIEPRATPKTIVERAVELKKQANRDAKRRADDNLKYDEVWCVFDVDDHRLIVEAKEQAKANGVEVAISNPCFELWALLHFQYLRADLESATGPRVRSRDLKWLPPLRSLSLVPWPRRSGDGRPHRRHTILRRTSGYRRRVFSRRDWLASSVRPPVRRWSWVSREARSAAQ